MVIVFSGMLVSIITGFVKWQNDILNPTPPEYNYTSVNDLFTQRYEENKYNYSYEQIEDYYFVSVTNKSIRKQMYVHDVIYMNETDDKLEFTFFEDGLEFDLYRRYKGVDLSTKTENTYTSHATFFMYEDSEYYIMYVADPREKIVRLNDTFGDFVLIESKDYEIDYYFNVVAKEDVTDEYIVEADIKGIGVMSFGRDEIIEAFED